MARYIFTLSLPDATGASRMALYFATAFCRRGHNVTVVHGPLPKNERSIVPEMQAAGIETICEPGLACPASPLLVGRLAKTFAHRSPHGIIGVQQRDRAVALQAANKIGVPSFIACQNSHTFWGRWPLNRLKERYYGWAVRKFVKKVICSSPVVQSELIHRFGLAEERTAFLPNAIELPEVKRLEEADRQKLRLDLGVQPNELMLLNVGRINTQKGQDLLIEAFAKVEPQRRKVKLVLVGGVSHDAQYEKMLLFREGLVEAVRRHGLADHVVFADWRNDIPALLQAADAYVHSARWEGFPLAPLEAMSASLPSIWTDCSGHPQGFANGEHGWVVPKENIPALSEAMERMIGLTAAERQTMGQACRRLVETHYDIQKVGAKFVDIVETSLTGPAA